MADTTVRTHTGDRSVTEGYTPKEPRIKSHHDTTAKLPSRTAEADDVDAEPVKRPVGAETTAPCTHEKVQNADENTEIQRMSRATTSRIKTPVEAPEMQQRDQVDYYRPSSTKEESDWRKPALVIQCQDRSLQVRIQDLRKSLSYMVFMTTTLTGLAYASLLAVPSFQCQQQEEDTICRCRKFDRPNPGYSEGPVECRKCLDFLLSGYCDECEYDEDWKDEDYPDERMYNNNEMKSDICRWQQ